MACDTRCIRFSWAISGVTQTNNGSLERSLAHSRETR